MSTELTLLAWCLSSVAVVQYLPPSILRTQERGPDYNASPRDSPSPVPEGVITGRLRRAQANLFETLPLFAVAILIAHAGGKEGELTYYGAWTYLIARLVYVPLYAAIFLTHLLDGVAGVADRSCYDPLCIPRALLTDHGSSDCLPQMRSQPVVAVGA